MNTKKKVVEPQTQTQTTEISHLPPELLFNIFSRLSITTLLRSVKRTCTLWYSIVESPIFPDMHLTHALDNPPSCLYAYRGSKNLYFADGPTIALKLPRDLGDVNMFNYLASCRGLISYASEADNSIYVCNPILGDHVRLPSLGAHLDLSVGAAFGYSNLTKQYKYLRFSFTEDLRYASHTVVGKIIALGEESWRNLAAPRGYVWQNAEYCNGALYWIVTSVNLASDCSLMSFDLDTEKFRIRRILPIDRNDDPDPIKSHYLSVIWETVAIVIQTRNETQQVWMLVDEAEDTWIEKYRLRVVIPEYFVSGHLRFTTPELFLSGHWMGLWTKHCLHSKETTIKRFNFVTRFISYDVDYKTFTEIMLPSTESDRRNANAEISLDLMISHVGSLLSPSKIAKAAATNQSCLATRFQQI